MLVWIEGFWNLDDGERQCCAQALRCELLHSLCLHFELQARALLGFEAIN